MDNLLSIVQKRLQREEDRFDLFGKSIDSGLREMDCATLQFIAEKLTSDVIFHGQMKSIQTQTDFVNLVSSQDLINE